MRLQCVYELENLSWNLIIRVAVLYFNVMSNVKYFNYCVHVLWVRLIHYVVLNMLYLHYYCTGSQPSQTKDFKLVVETPLSNTGHINGSSTPKLVDQNNVTGWDIIWLCLQCDISVREHYKVIIIPSVTSRQCPDMTWNVLKGMLKKVKSSLLFYRVLKSVP